MRATNLGALEVANPDKSPESIVGDAQIARVYALPADVDKVPSLIFLACSNAVHLNRAVLTSTFTYENGSEFLSLLVQELSES